MSRQPIEPGLHQLLRARPRPPVVALCAYVKVQSSPPYMPWIADVLDISGHTLAREMLVQLVLYGDKYGQRQNFSSVFWQEPLVLQAFDRSTLMTLCRKWAKLYPYDILDHHKSMVTMLQHYSIIDSERDGQQSQVAEADAAKVVAEAARSLGEHLHFKDLTVLCNCGLSAEVLHKAAMRVSVGAASLVLQGYVLAQPTLRRREIALLAQRVAMLLEDLQHEGPGLAGCGYRWILLGATLATGDKAYTSVPGIRVLRGHLRKMGWKFGIVAGNMSAGGRVVTVDNDQMVARPFSAASEEEIATGNEVLICAEPTAYVGGNNSQADDQFHPCLPPSEAAIRLATKYGGVLWYSQP